MSLAIAWCREEETLPSRRLKWTKSVGLCASLETPHWEVRELRSSLGRGPCPCQKAQTAAYRRVKIYRDWLSSEMRALVMKTSQASRISWTTGSVIIRAQRAHRPDMAWRDLRLAFKSSIVVCSSRA